MEKKAYNTSIKCTVSTCAYHNGSQDCCSLESIKVGCSSHDPTMCQGTECDSFKLGQGR